MPGSGEDTDVISTSLLPRLGGIPSEGGSTTSTSTATPPRATTTTTSSPHPHPLSENNGNSTGLGAMDPITATLNLVDNLTGDDNPPPPVIPLRKTDILLGRGADCQVTLSSLQISRRHCKLEFRNDKWFIRDMSTNGLLVGSVKAIKGQLYPLHHQNIVQLVPTGALSYRFMEVANRGQVPQPLPLPTSAITIDSDDDSLLSVDPGEDDQNVSVKEKVKKIGDGKKIKDDKDKCEEDGVQFLGIRGNSSPPTSVPKKPSSIIFTPTKRPLSPPSPSQFESQSSQSQSLLCTKKQKTDINDLLVQVERLQTENEMIKLERKIEREEFVQQRDIEVISFKEQYKSELNKKFSDVLESEFSCCVCSGVFVEPAISPSCGHTYCHFCISEWLKKKPECPICRSSIPKITPPKKHVEMGNYITRVYELLGEDYRERREAQLEDRLNEKVAAAAAEAVELQNQRNVHQQQLDMINQMQAVVNMGGLGARRRRGGLQAAAAAAAAGLGGPQGGVPLVTVTRRTTRRRNNAAPDINNANGNAQGGLPGGHQGPVPNNYNVNMVPPMFGINPRNARHPFFQMPMPHPQFPPFNNNFLQNRDVMMID